MWHKIKTDGLPKKTGNWYLFSGYSRDGSFVYNKYYIGTNGLVNGWSDLKERGITHWMEVPEPCGDER